MPHSILARTRLSKAWASFKLFWNPPVFSTPPRPSPLERGALQNTRAWSRSAHDWLSERNDNKNVDESARQGSFEAGLLLMGALERMGSDDKALLNSQESASHASFGFRLLLSAQSACGHPSESFAEQETRLHALWSKASGRLVEASSLSSIARSAERDPWWEAALAWGQSLQSLARQQQRDGALALSDEDCFSLCESAWAICFRSVALAGESGDDAESARFLLVWSLCCEWPWPERAVSAQTKEWVRRKWRDGLTPSYRLALEPAMAALGPNPAWPDLLLSKLSIVACSDPQDGARQRRLSALTGMLKSAVEREKLGAHLRTLPQENPTRSAHAAPRV